MDAPRYQRLRTLFERALDLDADARPAFLDAECADDPDLRDRLERMLASDGDDAFLVEPGLTFHELASPVVPVIDGYAFVERIGEGGMGEVWKAQQMHPVRRTVAVKVIRAGMTSPELLGRFELERQALALMDHGAIAQVFDAGVTADGRAYFSMDHIDGEPIHTWCRRHAIDLESRLRLFLLVCEGVEHAHAKAVLHRDLKPSNILVTTRNGTPQPKIIDFGVAKSEGLSLTENTLYTAAGMLIGTPEFMSPEQADGRAADTRSDVYSLGIVLYQLVTGEPTIDPSTLRGLGLETLLRRLREHEPTRPSQKAGLDLPEDLDWIVMTAIQKDPGQRYASVAALRADLERLLAHDPVAARPPTARYRLGKFVRRHRVGVAIATAALLTLLGFVGVLSVQNTRVAAERDRANRQAELAQRQARFLTDLFRGVRPDVTRGREVTARELLDAGRDRLRNELVDEPALRARLLYSIGGVYRELGEDPTAEELYLEAWELTKSHLTSDDPLHLALPNVLALTRRAAGDYAAALEYGEASYQGFVEEFGLEHKSTMIAANNIIDLYLVNERYEHAETFARALVERRRRVSGPEDKNTAYAETSLARALQALGRTDEAIEILTPALARLRRAVGDDHPNVAIVAQTLASMQTDAGAFAAAEKNLRTALAVQTEILPELHSDRLDTMGALAELCVRMDRMEDAQDLYREVYRGRHAIYEPDHPLLESTRERMRELGIDVESTASAP